MAGLLRKAAKRINSKFSEYTFSLGSPRMKWGYKNAPDGEYRPKTRYSNTTILYHADRISLADNIFIGHYTLLDGTGGLKIGEGTQIGAYSYICTHSSHLSIRIHGDEYTNVHEDDKKCYQRMPVNIGRFVFIGAMVCILPGVTIGDGALISAGAVVKKDIEDFAIADGNPAVKIGDTREMDKKAWSDEYSKHYYQGRIGIHPDRWWKET